MNANYFFRNICMIFFFCLLPQIYAVNHNFHFMNSNLKFWRDWRSKKFPILKTLHCIFFLFNQMNKSRTLDGSLTLQQQPTSQKMFRCRVHLLAVFKIFPLRRNTNFNFFKVFIFFSYIWRKKRHFCLQRLQSLLSPSVPLPPRRLFG